MIGRRLEHQFIHLSGNWSTAELAVTTCDSCYEVPRLIMPLADTSEAALQNDVQSHRRASRTVQEQSKNFYDRPTGSLLNLGINLYCSLVNSLVVKTTSYKDKAN